MAKWNDNLGTYHIAQHPELYTPARSNNFVFMPIFNTGQTELIKSGWTVDAASQDKDNGYIDANSLQETLMLSVSSATVPHYKQNVIELKRSNGKVKFAGAVEYPSGTLKFNDYIGADTKSCLIAWRNLAFNQSDETIGKASDYKIKGVLIEYSPSHEQIRYWDLFGCWISEISEGDFSSDDDGKREITVNIEYDRAIEHLPDNTIKVKTTEETTEETQGE